MSDEWTPSSHPAPSAQPAPGQPTPRAGRLPRRRRWLVATAAAMLALAGGLVLVLPFSNKAPRQEHSFPDGNFKVKLPRKADHQQGPVAPRAG